MRGDDGRKEAKKPPPEEPPGDRTAEGGVVTASPWAMLCDEGVAELGVDPEPAE